ncbi:MAG: nitroreductase family protein [Myxococcota bacterium]
MPLPTVPYRIPAVPPAEVEQRLRRDLAVAETRRSVRHFSTELVSREAISAALAIAGTAPSGAHRQPWHFVAIGDPEAKARLREAAEAEERAFYAERASQDWLEDLEPLGTDTVKTHLTDAPWVIVVFRRDWEERGGKRRPNYYVTESVGIAVGMLLSSLHRAGLATLTHTPSPMAFLRELCGRPVNEKPFVVIPVGWPAADCEVPDLRREPLDRIATFL